MALTRVSGGVIQQDNFSIGIVTASNGTFSGNLNVAGVSTFQGNVDLGDGDRLRLGAGDDLQIFHESASSSNFISASPNFKLLTDTFRLNNAANNNNIIVADAGDGVDLYFNNSRKFATTGFGVTVYDTVQAPQLNITGVSTFGNTITAVDASFSGNVSVAGTLTYEDVTNIDSIGIVTARSGIHVTGGSVGIGTDNPTNQITAVSSSTKNVIARFKAANLNPNFDIVTDVSSHGAAYVKNNLGASKVALLSNGNSYFTGGSVGIGTDNPSAKVDSRASSNQYVATDDVTGDTLYTSVTGGEVTFNSFANRPFVFKQYASERLRITSSGDVGIGTTNPDKKLRVEGDARITGTLTMGTASIEIAGDSDFPTIRPTLDLNFAATKTLDRRITFTRDSIGTYTDELGIVRYASNNVPRFDHDPTTGESLGLLIEESRTNLVTYSENFVGNYNLTNVTLNANSTISPSGDLDATTVTATLGAATGIEYSQSFSNLVNYTISLFVKRKSGSNTFEIRSAGGGTSRISASFSLENETSSYLNQATSSSIISYPNGWFKCSVSGPISSDENRILFLNGMTLNEEFYIWGSQLEAGSFPTSYIPTSGSTVTRAVEYGHTSNMDFYNQNEGSVVSEIKLLDYGSIGGKVIWSLNQAGGFGEGIYFVSEDGLNNISYSVQNSGSQFSGGSFTPNNFIKSAIGLKENSMINYFDGSLVGSEDTSGTIPNNIGRLVIGNNAWGNSFGGSNGLNPGNCHIKSFAYYNKRLTNAQLQSLTRQ